VTFAPLQQSKNSPAGVGRGVISRDMPRSLLRAALWYSLPHAHCVVAVNNVKRCQHRAQLRHPRRRRR
jgi:hypothetical protein